MLKAAAAVLCNQKSTSSINSALQLLDSVATSRPLPAKYNVHAALHVLCCHTRTLSFHQLPRQLCDFLGKCLPALPACLPA
jgi:hypothetical protein